MVDWERRELPIRTQAELLGLNRSGLYYKPKPPSGEELALKRSIDEIFTEHPYYGSRRITAALRRRGFDVNRKAVIAGTKMDKRVCGRFLGLHEASLRLSRYSIGLIAPRDILMRR